MSVQLMNRKGSPAGGLARAKYLVTNQWQLICMSVPFLILVIIFVYSPLYGWVMAFQNFKPKFGIFNQPWVGLAQFKFLFTNPQFLMSLRNTVAMSVLNLTVCTAAAIFLALMINEMRNIVFKKVVQTISYLPYFVSWIIACMLIYSTLSVGGIFNELLKFLGIIKTDIIWLGIGKDFWGITAISHAWKTTGWNTIIYLAALTSVNPELYEAAEMDGAGRFKKMWHVSLPGMRSTILILLIMNIGRLMSQGFDVQYLLGNGLTNNYSEVLDIFVLKYGISIGNYSLATAAGIFKSLVSVILLLSANKLSSWIFHEKLI